MNPYEPPEQAEKPPKNSSRWILICFIIAMGISDARVSYMRRKAWEQKIIRLVTPVVTGKQE